MAFQGKVNVLVINKMQIHLKALLHWSDVSSRCHLTCSSILYFLLTQSYPEELTQLNQAFGVRILHRQCYARLTAARQRHVMVGDFTAVMLSLTAWSPGSRSLHYKGRFSQLQLASILLVRLWYYMNILFPKTFYLMVPASLP